MRIKIKSNRGITLITLVITIVILMILSTVTITVGVSQINATKLKGFYTKLEIAQEGIEKIANTNESYTDSNNTTIYLKDLGTTPTEEQDSLITSLGYDSTNFRYFTTEEIENELGISGVDLNLLIDFKNKVVISSEGIEVAGTKYYMLENTKYSVNLDETKNKGNIDFSYYVSQYGSNSYKITITPINIGDIKEGTVKYRKTGVAYWTVAKNNEIIIHNLADYDIMYIDANNNSVTKTITVTLDDDGNVITEET